MTLILMGLHRELPHLAVFDAICEGQGHSSIKPSGISIGTGIQIVTSCSKARGV